MTISVGTCSWTSRVNHLAQQLFNTPRPTAEQVLRCYSTKFNTVEVDSTFYGLPSAQTCRLWAQRTPPGFKFHVKTLSSFTKHRIKTQSLPADIRRALDPHLQRVPQLDAWEIPTDVQDELWRRYREALEPLRQNGKLGHVLMQFAPWFEPSKKSAEYILSCKERLPGIKIAVEFRSKRWFKGRLETRTPEFLRDNDLTMVTVDMPQGFNSSVPPIIEATSDEAYVRLHGRNAATWQQAGMAINRIHDYLYSLEELDEWMTRVRHLEEQTSRVYVMFNTVQGLTSAIQFQQMLFPESEEQAGAESSLSDMLV